MTNPLQQLAQYKQSPWFDNIHRAMLQNGELYHMIKNDGLKGVTSNPTIFEKAIGGSADYDQAIMDLIKQGKSQSSEDVFFHLAVEDIQAAADLFKPVYEESDGLDGMVSLEVSPDLAYDTAATVRQAIKLRQWVDRDNVMIKVPATPAGIPAVETLIAEGIHVNVTLLFSVERYRQAAQAYINGLGKRHAAGKDIHAVTSVASFFVSRVDAAVDALLDGKNGEAMALQGNIAIANAKVAYAAYRQITAADPWQQLKAAGARPQRLLWASTGTKNPQYSDVLYIDELIGADTVTTIPPKTYQAFRDHGSLSESLARDMDGARDMIDALAGHGVDLAAVTQALEDKGVASFAKSFHSLLGVIEQEIQSMQKKVGSAGR